MADVDAGPLTHAVAVVVVVVVVVDALRSAPQSLAALIRPTQPQIDQSPSKLKILKKNIHQSNLA